MPPLSDWASCRRVCGVWLLGEVAAEEELRWCMCFSLRRVSGGLIGRSWWVCCLSCLRVTGADVGSGGEEKSCCFRVAGAGGWAEEVEAEEAGGGAAEQSCLRVTGGEGEDEDDVEDEAWRPFTSSLTLLLVLLLGLALLRTTSASLFTALLSSLGMILAR